MLYIIHWSMIWFTTHIIWRATFVQVQLMSFSPERKTPHTILNRLDIFAEEKTHSRQNIFLLLPKKFLFTWQINLVNEGQRYMKMKIWNSDRM